MSQEVSFEQGKYGNRAVLHTAWSDSLLRSLTEHDVVELELNMAKGWRGEELSFLSQLPWLVSLDILDLNIRDIRQIHALHFLRRLGVTTCCSTEIDFVAFPRLESCGLEWRTGSESLFKCTTLTDLFVNNYKGTGVEPFARLVRLESLSILNAPIVSLRGLGGLSRLRSMRLARLRRLCSLAGIDELTLLEELNVQSCRRIGSIREIASLSGLRRVHITNCGDIASLAPLDDLKKLEWFTFVESTNVVDGDLSPLVRQEHLTRLSFQNRRHYTHRREEFKAYSGKENDRARGEPEP